MLTSRRSSDAPIVLARRDTESSSRDSTTCRVLRCCRSNTDSGRQSHSIIFMSLVNVFETVRFSSASLVGGEEEDPAASGSEGMSAVPQMPSEMSRSEMDVREREVAANISLNRGWLTSRTQPSIRRWLIVGRWRIVLIEFLRWLDNLLHLTL